MGFSGDQSRPLLGLMPLHALSPTMAKRVGGWVPTATAALTLVGGLGLDCETIVVSDELSAVL